MTRGMLPNVGCTPVDFDERGGSRGPNLTKLSRQDDRIRFNPECTETEKDLMEIFAELYGKNGMIHQANADRIKLMDARAKVERITEALERGADPMKVIEALDRVEVEVNGRLRR